MTSRLSQEYLAELNRDEVKNTTQAGSFFEKYPNDLEDFYRDLLTKKGFTDRARHNLFGVGDVSFFVNRKINMPDFVKAGVIGIGLTAPTGVKTDMDYVWPCQLGNGGFWELRGHTSLFWRNSGFFNPHVFGEVKFRIGSSVKRRVAPMVKHRQSKVTNEDNITINELQQTVGIIQNPVARDFSIPESRIPAFAQGPLASVDINPGLKAKIRVGNLFNGVGFDCAYLDVFYMAEFEQEENVSHRQAPEYDVKDIMMQHSHRYSQSIGAAYCYRFDDNTLFELNVTHVAMGHNTPRTTKIGCAMQYNF